MTLAAHLRDAIERTEFQRRQGTIVAYNGVVIEAEGPDAGVGELCEVQRSNGESSIMAQVVGFRRGHMLLMPYADVGGRLTQLCHSCHRQDTRGTCRAPTIGKSSRCLLPSLG